tara:strand:- start:158742 stop:159911 length:1170 start_codon:yes stop_codon:yes gene_type:complete
MSRFHSYLNSTATILSEYDGTQPFSLFLKRYFSRHKKFGSRDRRLIGDYCFFYFRLGNAFKERSMDERILTGIFLCSTQPNRMLETHKPDWNERAGDELSEKLNFLGISEDELYRTLFPFYEFLSEGILHHAYARSFFTKPDVFLRIRPGKEASVRPRLKSAHIPFKEHGAFSLSVSPKEKIDQIFNVDSTLVIQDLSSQRVGNVMRPVLEGKDLNVWDSCAASGGKSILAYDINPKITLTVTDVRTNILNNLSERFEKAGIDTYKSAVMDLSNPVEGVPGAPFDVIIADVPCTGSGTWARTPEQLFYFDEAKISEYASLQRTIIQNALPHLKKGGHLIYITCSVFRQENEENVTFIEEELGLTKLSADIIAGYEVRADSMFASVFRKD